MSFAEKELTRCKAELQQILADRDSLKEDLNVIKEAKRQGDLTLKQQHEKITTLDRELLFYQQQVSSACRTLCLRTVAVSIAGR